MTIRFSGVYLAVVTAFFISCTASKPGMLPPSGEQGDMQHVMLDSMTVRPEQGAPDPNMRIPYKPAAERHWDLQHTRLELSFNWPDEAVIGKASLTLSPYFYPQNVLKIDAVEFEISSISIDGHPTTDFQNTGQHIIIPLSRTYKKDEILQADFTYTARPRATRDDKGQAISSNKGLFFIDPQDTIPGLPMQIWTQGETTYNSKWFPTLDQPNERCSQEVILLVPDTMMTLSNGILIASEKVAAGMRRDHWRLDLPSAPYLTMIAVGQWDKITEYWRGRPVEYYVDPGYGPSARMIFQHTPEMLEFFSGILGYDFVWPKYAQIIVKQFVSGAMENTTAVVYGDFVQFNIEDMVEEGTNDYIVAHELFHHWFGNLVTCESWANLTLNEGFANYAEYLWQEYKYGRERADISRINELSSYFNQTAYDVHPLIHYHYDDEQSMFDAHSYSKGALVLHMLRDLVGEDAFFASLRYYLQRHAYGAAEIDDLRLAFEHITGKDLHWFFNQWFFGNGHPVLKISHHYDAGQRSLTIDFTQTQHEKSYLEVFQLPFEVAIIHRDSTIETQRLQLDSIQQSFSIPTAEQPLAVIIDPRDILLAVIQHDIPSSEYSLRAIAPVSINHRISALRLMGQMDPEIMDILLEDTSMTMRALLISRLAEMEEVEKLHELAQQESRELLIYYIMHFLQDLDSEKAMDVALRLLETSEKTPVIYDALMAVAQVDLDEATHQLAHFKDNNTSALYVATAQIYAEKGEMISLDYFIDEPAARIRDEYLEDLIGAMALYLSREEPAVQQKGLAIIDSEFFLDKVDSPYRRFYLITGLLKQYGRETQEGYTEKLLQTIKSLYRKETSEYIRTVLKEGLGDLLD